MGNPRSFGTEPHLLTPTAQNNFRNSQIYTFLITVETDLISTWSHSRDSKIEPKFYSNVVCIALDSSTTETQRNPLQPCSLQTCVYCLCLKHLTLSTERLSCDLRWCGYPNCWLTLRLSYPVLFSLQDWKGLAFTVQGVIHVSSPFCSVFTFGGYSMRWTKSHHEHVYSVRWTQSHHNIF